MRENFSHWVVTFLIFLYIVELLVYHKHLWYFSPLFFFSYLSFILLVCASMHACVYVCVGGYEHVLSLRSQMTTFGSGFLLSTSDLSCGFCCAVYSRPGGLWASGWFSHLYLSYCIEVLGLQMCFTSYSFHHEF